MGVLTKEQVASVAPPSLASLGGDPYKDGKKLRKLDPLMTRTSCNFYTAYGHTAHNARGTVISDNDTPLTFLD